MRKALPVILAVLLTAGLAPAPVAARAAELTMKAALWQTTVAIGGEDQYAVLSGRLSAPDSHSHRVTYSVDHSAVTGFAEVEFLGYPSDGFLFSGPDPSAPPEDPCDTDGTVISCTQTVAAQEQLLTLGILTVRATSAATPGDSARVVVTVQVDDGPETVTRSLVRVGEPVNIAAGDELKIAVRPGETVQVSPQVRNAGTNPVDGSVAVFAFPPSSVTGTFQNCRYSAYVVCSFETVLQPGRTYRVSPGLKVRIPTGVAGGSSLDGGGVWITKTDWEDGQIVFQDPEAVPGTGGILRLEPLPGSVGVPQVEISPDDNFAAATLTVAGTRPDVAAVGAEVTGAVGDEVTVKVGVVNHGPGTLRPDLFDNNLYVTSVRLPQNLEVITPDERCDDFTVKENGLYECAEEASALKRNDPALYTFRAKIRKGRAGDGEVSVLNYGDTPLEYGKDEQNNTATIKVEVRTDGAGGGLPVRGPAAS